MSGSLGRRKPLRIGQKWYIDLPDAASPPPMNAVRLILPWGAFGSGEHETTASCLEEIEQLAPFDGMEVLDIGCGTGVLALAALLLGAGRAVGIDIDARAAATTLHAARLNQLSDRMVVVLGPLDAIAPAQYALILANLHGDVLLDLADAMVTAAAPGARILLSGVAWEYAFLVREKFAGLGCLGVRERWLEEYVTLTLTAPV
ncbi:MAG: methyltransferase [bacterium]|nr:methyltransferase [bacterium]